jgi:hypothetical protein
VVVPLGAPGNVRGILTAGREPGGVLSFLAAARSRLSSWGRAGGRVITLLMDGTSR